VADDSTPTNAFHRVAAIFLVLALGIGASGYLYFQNSRRQIEHAKHGELLAVAKLKVREISWWRAERLGDAAVLSRTPLLGFEVARWLSGRNETQLNSETLSWMRAIRGHYDYSNVLLLDTEGNVKLSLTGQDRMDPELFRSVPWVVNSREVLFYDLHWSETADGIRAALLAPILDQQAPGTPVTGILVLEIDPHRFLYPLLQSWPNQSPTAETLLARKEGCDVVFLNELRHRKDSALKLRLPLAETDLPAAMAIEGREGIVEGVDYRGVPVLASLRSIPESPWFLITKVDQREVYTPIEDRARWVALIVAMLLVGAGGSIALVWSRYQARFYRREQEVLQNSRAELEKKVLERTSELTESKERFRQIAEHIREVFYIANADLTEILYISPAYEETWGRPRRNLLQNPGSWSEAIHPEDREKATATMVEVGATGHAIEYRIVRPNGTVRWIWDRGFPILDERGMASRYAGIAEDITERKQSEDALRLDEARFESLFRLSQMAQQSAEEIMDFALDQQVGLTRSEIGFIGFMNDEETVLTMRSWSQEMLKHCVVTEQSTHFPLEGAGLWAEAIRQRQPIIVNDYGAPHPGKQGIPGGHIELKRFMCVPVLDGDHIVALAAVANKQGEYDPSDARQLGLFLDGVWKLVQRKKIEQALNESERLASMGRALSSVAHDLKAPLIAIGGFSRLVRGHLNADHPDCQKLDIVIKETRRLENMVKDMLDFSRPLELHRSTEDLDQTIAECLAILQKIAIERKVLLRKPHSLNSVFVSMDVMRMKQVIVNLLVNAIQASPEGEVVTIQTSSQGTLAAMEIIDRGPGIAVDKRKEIFSPFFTTKKEGTGLGLAIVKKIVEAHEGRITIVDNLDRGLTFRVELPNRIDSRI
jgi:PAS domain S-box-containing protein